MFWRRLTGETKGQETSSELVSAFADNLAETIVNGDLHVGNWSTDRGADIRVSSMLPSYTSGSPLLTFGRRGNIARGGSFSEETGQRAFEGTGHSRSCSICYLAILASMFASYR